MSALRHLWGWIVGEGHGALVSIATALWLCLFSAVEVTALSVAFRILSAAETVQGAADAGAGATSASESSSVST